MIMIMMLIISNILFTMVMENKILKVSIADYEYYCKGGSKRWGKIN